MERNLQHYCARKCNVKVGTLFIFVANVLKDTKCKAESKKVTQWSVLHSILFFMPFKLQGNSLCGRIYLVLSNSLCLWTRKTYIRSWSWKRVALYYTVAIWGLMPDEGVWFCLFKTRPKYLWRLTCFPEGCIPVVYFSSISTSLTHTNEVWEMWNFTVIHSLKLPFLKFMISA